MGRWWVLVTVAAALIGAGMVDGIVQRTILSDGTNLVWVIVAVGILGTIASRAAPSWTDWITTNGVSVMLGLLGTVLGFTQAISGAIAGDPSLKFAGASTALATTACGIVVHLYLLLLLRVVRGP